MKSKGKKKLKVILNILLILVVISIVYFAKYYFDSYYGDDVIRIKEPVTTEEFVSVEDDEAVEEDSYKEEIVVDNEYIIEKHIEKPEEEEVFDSVDELISGKDFVDYDFEEYEYDKEDYKRISETEIYSDKRIGKLRASLKRVATDSDQDFKLVVQGDFVFYYNRFPNKNFYVGNEKVGTDNIFTDKLNNVSVIALNEKIESSPKISEKDVSIGKNVYIYLPKEKNEIIVKSNIISTANNFAENRFSDLFRLKGFFDADFLGAYVLDSNFDVIGITVYYQQYKSNNLYFISKDKLKQYINILKNNNIRYFDLDFRLIQHFNGLQVINSKSNLFQTNDVIMKINGKSVYSVNSFYNLIYSSLIKQKLTVDILRNEDVITKIYRPEESLSFLEKDLGLTFMKRHEGFEITDTNNEGTRFLRQKGLNKGDVLISVNDITFQHHFDFYLVKQNWKQKNMNNRLLFKTLRNTYVFFDN